MKNILIFFVCFSFFSIVSAQDTITIKLSERNQIIEGFGASDCWSPNFVGKYWEETEKSSIARYLFSNELKTDGSPRGIGLSMWRVNLGAGTTEQWNGESGITDKSRTSECFLLPDGTYDWTKQSGQQWIIDKAKEYGCENFVLFSNSPPVHYTRNGQGYAPGDWYANLQDDKYDDFAVFMANVLDYFKTEKGIDFKYVSPCNEPQFRWEGSGQEGTPWKNSEITKLTKELNKAIQEKNLSTKILIAEASSYDHLYGGTGQADNQINQFFSSAYSNYIGNLPSVEKCISSHSYWTESTDVNLKATRERARNAAKKARIGLHQTEWSMLQGGEGIPDNLNEATYMDIALFLGKIIHADMRYADIISWSYWTSMDVERWSHKNRFLLMRLIPAGGDYGDIAQSGVGKPSKTMWALGNFSRFVKPGYTRVNMTGADDLKTLMGTAYVSPDGKNIVTVYVNMSNEAKVIRTNFENLVDLEVKKQEQFVTSNTYDLTKIRNLSADYTEDGKITIPARSISTVVFTLEGTLSTVEVKKESDNFAFFTIDGKLSLHVDKNWHDTSTLIQLNTLDGKMIWKTDKYLTGINTIDPPTELSKGIYLLTISNSKKKQIFKISKK